MRIWTNPEGLFDTLIVLTEQVLLVQTLSDSELSEAEAKLEEGQAAHEVLSGKGTLIALSSITRVKSNLRGDSLDVYYRQGNKRTSKNISCVSPCVRDEVLAAMEETLGP